MKLTLTFFILCGTLIIAGAQIGDQLPSPVAVKVDEIHLAVPKNLSLTNRINFPFFASDGQLQWNSSPIMPLDGCPLDQSKFRHDTRLLEPRVDEIGCQLKEPGRPPEQILLGIDESNQIRWTRKLGFPTGKFIQDEWLLGASKNGVVFNNLEVLDPYTGKVISSAPTRLLSDEHRSVPEYNFSYTGIFLPRSHKFAVFEADVTLGRREGGLYFIDPANHTKELVIPVVATFLGGYWSVEHIAVDDEERLLFLAQQLSVRGPGEVSLVIFDITARRIIFEERFAKGQYCRNPRVVLGPGGRVGFAYFDETARKQILVHYQIARPSQP